MEENADRRRESFGLGIEPVIECCGRITQKPQLVTEVIEKVLVGLSIFGHPYLASSVDDWNPGR